VTRKRGGRRSSVNYGSSAGAPPGDEVVSAANDEPTAKPRAQHVSNTGASYEGPTARTWLDNLRSLTSGDKLLVTTVLALAGAAVYIMVAASRIELSLGTILSKVEDSATEVRDLQAYSTRNEERVVQLQRSIDDTKQAVRDLQAEQREPSPKR
jgi:cell division protein FtsL